MRKLDRPTAAETEKKMIEALSALAKKGQVKTITSDNGIQFANHQAISLALGADFYFAKPYHSWERGTNENTNGLIRQYIPKSSDFNLLSEDDIRQIEDKLNKRPRKRLNFTSPYEAVKAKTKIDLKVAFRA
jgi:IS30 family transposase